MKKFLKYSAVGILFTVAGACFAYPHVLWSATVAYSDFDGIGENVYLDKRFTVVEKENLVLVLQQAKHRIESNFGSFSSLPKIIVASDIKRAKRFGIGNAPAVAHIAPWEQYIVIGPKAVSVDIIAHELFHAEVVERIGYWAWQTKLPVWLSEGLSMQVDYRPQYLLDSKKGISHTQFNQIIVLQKSSQFWSDNKEDNIENYRLAKSAVSEILKNNNEDLYAIFERISAGEEPVVAFKVAETNKALQRENR